jgi:hypothetical protein
MNHFATGGTGYPDSAVTAALPADGHTVRAHARSTASAGRLPAGAEPYYLGAGAHTPAMTELATAASRSRGLNGRIAAEPEAGSRARLGLFLATFMVLPDITVVNTALPSIHGEES